MDHGLFKYRTRIKLQPLNDETKSIKQSFQDGCNTLVSKCTELGVTPVSNSPSDISNAIQTIANNQWSAGNTNGWSAGHTAGYNEGRTQGQQDVISNPGGFGIATRSGYAKTASFKRWPGSGRQDYAYINDYPQYQSITTSNIKVGILNSGGHGTDDFGGDDQGIGASCNGYDPSSGRVSIWITGNIRAGNYIICVI